MKEKIVNRYVMKNRAKLDERNRKIKEMRESEKSIEVIAKKFNLSISSISRISGVKK